MKTVVLLLALALAACGGKKTPATPTNKTGSATTDNKMEGTPTNDKKPDGEKKPEGGDVDPCAVPPP